MDDSYEDIRDALVRKGRTLSNASVEARRLFTKQRGPRPATFGDAVTGRKRARYYYGTDATGGGASKEKFE